MLFLSHKHFELLKGIGILSVLISHIGGYSGLTWFTPLGGIGVAIFLFCSGYGLYCSYTKTGLQNFWKKKIVNVYSTYFLIEVITALLYSRSVMTVLLDLLLIRPAYCYGWYMQYLFGCYFVFFLVFKYVKNEKGQTFILSMLAILSFFCLDGLRGEQAFSFVGGILTALVLNKGEVHFKHGVFLAILSLVLSVGLLAVKQHPIIRQQPLYVLTLFNLLIKGGAAVSIIYLTYAIKCIYFIGDKLSLIFGKLSYVLYLVHGYLIVIISDSLLGNYLIDSIVFLAITLIVSYLVNILAKKFATIWNILFRII